LSPLLVLRTTPFTKELIYCNKNNKTPPNPRFRRLTVEFLPQDKIKCRRCIGKGTIPHGEIGITEAIEGAGIKRLIHDDHIDCPMSSDANLVVYEVMKRAELIRAMQTSHKKVGVYWYPTPKGAIGRRKRL